jgi:hypothetical protein
VSYFPKTRAATRYAASREPSRECSALARGRAAALLHRLHACEAALDAAGGHVTPAGGQLRDLVLAARDLAGPSWLAASADDPDVEAFTVLESAPAPPAPADLDEVLSRVLWARFAPRTVGSASRQKA